MNIDQNQNTQNMQIKQLQRENEQLKRERQQLLQQGGQLQLALEVSEIVLWTLDLKTWALYCSPEMLNMLGYRADEVNIDLNLLKSIHRSDQWEDMNRVLMAHINGETPVYQHEHEVYTRKRGWIWISARGRVVRDPDSGVPLKLVGVLIDINQQMQREARLTSEIDALTEIIPICSSCKKIRNDAGYWEQVEAYFERFPKINFSHGLCEICLHKLYGDQKWFKGLKQQESDQKPPSDEA